MKKQNISKSGYIRQHRTFSDALKKRIVTDIVHKRATVTQVSREYEVTRSAVYKWLSKYAPLHSKPVKMVVEMESESYRSQTLLKRVAELERVVGQKQLELDYLEKLLEFAGQELGQDLKKTFSSRLSNGSVKTSKPTPTA